MCANEMPAWAMLTFGVLTFAFGFEAGRMFSWLHHLYVTRRTAPVREQENAPNV